MFKRLLFNLIFLMLPVVAMAENDATKELWEVGTKAGPYDPAPGFSLSSVIGPVISAFLALIGIIFLVLMLYAGYHWMTARGEEEKVEKAKDTIKRAIIGIIIVVGAYAIWKFISSYLL